MTEHVELYRKYRPTSLKQLYGQSAAVKSLSKKIKKNKVDHANLLIGRPGCGKTTIARILAIVLGAKDTDVTEYNSADFKSIDDIRTIRQNMGRAPFGKCRIWILNEVHQYSKIVQDAMLEMLEDTPDHVYFFLTTTDAQKLNEAFKSRLTTIMVQSLEPKEMKKLIQYVLLKERKKLKANVIDKIIEIADGGARKALVLLGQVIYLKKVKDQLNILEHQDTEKQAFDLARKLMNPWCKWSDIIGVIKELGDVGDEARRIIAGYGTTVALSGNPKTLIRGLLMIDCFYEPYYNVSGKTGLTKSCALLLQPYKTAKK